MKPCKEHHQVGKNPYGSVRWMGRRIGFHRREWIKHNGPIPNGVEVCHTCDNKRCYEITHLFLGTHKTNMEDMKNKGACGPRKPSAITTAQVAEMRALYPAVTQGELAVRYGVSRSTVSRLIGGKVRAA